MKSPDEIKKGLECCRNLWDCKNKDCPYLGDGCYPKLHEDTKALVQKLQAENDDLIGENGQLLIEVTLLQAKTKQLEAERDAALEDRRGECTYCAYLPVDTIPQTCFDCANKGYYRWEWRGVQKEDSDA